MYKDKLVIKDNNTIKCPTITLQCLYIPLIDGIKACPFFENTRLNCLEHNATKREIQYHYDLIDLPIKPE
jgi:hypothetical protein